MEDALFVQEVVRAVNVSKRYGWGTAAENGITCNWIEASEFATFLHKQVSSATRVACEQPVTPRPGPERASPPPKGEGSYAGEGRARQPPSWRGGARPRAPACRARGRSGEMKAPRRAGRARVAGKSHLWATKSTGHRPLNKALESQKAR